MGEEQNTFEKGEEGLYDIRDWKIKTEYVSYSQKKYKYETNYEREVGVRYLANGNWGLVSGPSFLRSMIEEAKEIAMKGKGKVKIKRKGIKAKERKRVYKEDLMGAIKYIVKNLNGKNKVVSIQRSVYEKHYEDSFGREIDQRIPYLWISISNIKKKNGIPFVGRVRFCWTKSKLPELNNLVEEANKKLEILLKAKIAPPGRYDLILNPTLAGVFFHEAVGHATEADSIIEKESVFRNMKGKMVANEKVSMYDDPTIYPENGYYAFDDEGTKGRRKALIKNGVLVNYLHSLTTSSLMNEKPNGNGRSQSPSSFPIPRMSNITIDKGDLKLEEMIESVKEGFMGIDSFGGEVDPSTGNFLFNAQYGYKIERGKIKEPILNVSFGGNILETLKRIEVGNKLIHTWVGGFCGKKGQTVPVSEYMPYVLVRGAIVGGRIS